MNREEFFKSVFGSIAVAAGIGQVKAITPLTVAGATGLIGSSDLKVTVASTPPDRVYALEFGKTETGETDFSTQFCIDSTSDNTWTRRFDKESREWSAWEKMV